MKIIELSNCYHFHMVSLKNVDIGHKLQELSHLATSFLTTKLFLLP